MAKKIKGSAAEAEEWIKASTLSEEQKEALLNFVKRFKDLTFFKKERPETEPAWLRELGEVLLGAVPDDLCWYQFSSFDHSEYDDYRYQDSFYGVQGFGQDLGEYSQIFLEGEPLIILACVLEDLGSVLAVKGGQSGDLGIYDFNYEDVQRGEAGTGIIDTSDTMLAFPSYIEMLNRVSAMMLPGEVVIEAQC